MLTDTDKIFGAIIEQKDFKFGSHGIIHRLREMNLLL